MAKQARRKGARLRECESDSEEDGTGGAGGAPGAGILSGGSASSRRRKWKRREGADLNLIIVQEDVEASKTGTPSWASAHAGASNLLPRRFCCCCSFPAIYRCSECSKKRSSNCATSGALQEEPCSQTRAKGRYCCSVECLSRHKAADCQPRHMLN